MLEHPPTTHGPRHAGPRSGRVVLVTDRSEAGTTMVEGAIVALLFFSLIFGIMEFGLAWRSNLTVANATQSGARRAATEGNDPAADFEILRSIIQGSAIMNLDDVDTVVIFKATGSPPLATVPAGCKTAPIIGVCNFYTGAQIRALDAGTGFVVGTDIGRCDVDYNPGGYVDQFWAPCDRDDVLSPVGPDIVGIWIKARHNYITGFIGNGVDLTDTALARIEPQVA